MSNTQQTIKPETVMKRISQIRDELDSPPLAENKIIVEALISQCLTNMDDDKARSQAWTMLRSQVSFYGFEFPSEATNPLGYSTIGEVGQNVHTVYADLENVIVEALSPYWEKLSLCSRHGGGAYDDLRQMLQVRIFSRIETTIVQGFNEGRWLGKMNKDGILQGFTHVQKEASPSTNEETSSNEETMTEGA